MDYVEQAVREIKGKLEKELDLENETYLLQTPSAYMQIGLEEDGDGERKLNVQVTGGNITYLKTDKDIFKDLYVNDDDNDN